MITPTPSDTTTGRDQSILFSPFGVGKTTMALTASSDCPAHLTSTIQAPPASTPMVTISDMAWIAYDRNALKGFANLKVRVPLLFDLSTVAPNKIVEETLDILKHLQTEKTPHVVLDTLTALDTALNNRHRAKQSQKMQFYDAILSDHMRIYEALRMTSAEVQLLAHVKAAFDADDAAKAKRQTLEMPDFAAAITGQAGGRYKADCDNILFLQRKTTMASGKKSTKVVVRTQPQGGTECKVRGGSGLPDEMDADWRVIRAALGAQPMPVF
jgi:hypothetical protein